MLGAQTTWLIDRRELNGPLYWGRLIRRVRTRKLEQFPFSINQEESVAVKNHGVMVIINATEECVGSSLAGLATAAI